MKRFGALLLSVGLVAAALWLRGRLDDPRGTDDSGDARRITCATEVYRACEALAAEHSELEITTEDAGDTTSRLASLSPGADPGFDVWLTTTPFSAIAGESLGAAAAVSPLGPSSGPLGHARLGFWVHQTRAAALEAHCGQVGWPCLLAAAPKRWEAIGGDPAWGPLKPHIDEPNGSGGLLALGNAAAVLVGADADALAVEENAAFVGAITGLAQARVKPGLESGAALTRMLAGGPAEVDIVIALESEGARFGAAATSKARLIYPSPVAASVAYALPRSGGGKGLEKLMELIEEDAPGALRATGWRPGAGPDAEGFPTLGGLLSIKRIWEEIR